MVPLQTRGVVIKTIDHGESDKIVTMYSPLEGKIGAIAKGAKRSKIRFVNKLEMFSHLDLEISKKYSLPQILQADLLQSHTSLRSDYRLFAYAEVICQLIYQWGNEGEGDENLYALLLWGLSQLNQRAAPPQATFILYLVKLYNLVGYQPNLEGCHLCHRLDSTGGPYRFNPAQSAIYCHACSQTSIQKGISLPTIKLIQHAQALPLDKLPRLQFSRQNLQEAFSLFKSYTAYLLQKDLSSWEILEQMQGGMGQMSV